MRLFLKHLKGFVTSLVVLRMRAFGMVELGIERWCSTSRIQQKLFARWRNTIIAGWFRAYVGWSWQIHLVSWWSRNIIVTSCYAKLDSNTMEHSNVMTKAPPELWKIKVLSNIQVFGWMMIIERLSISDQLIKRGILNGVRDKCCVLCFQEDKDKIYLFNSWAITKRI